MKTRAYLLVMACLAAVLAAGCATKFGVGDTGTGDGVDDQGDAGDTTVPPGCGDGEPDEDEECDDGNDIDGDGCDNDCTWSCHGASDCVDGEECNGEEHCEMDSHTCVSGEWLTDGTLVEVGPPRIICLEGESAESECGDGFVDTGAGEFCDPPGDEGCQEGCVWGCEGDGDCPDDGNLCNGEEYCDMGAHVCDRRNVPSAGTPCDDLEFCTEVDRCEAGTCVGEGNPCDDDIPCTDDVCDSSARECSSVIMVGQCLIGDECWLAGEDRPGEECQECDPSVSQTSWTGTTGPACTADSFSCTDDLCDAGACTHPLMSGQCLIDGACWGSGAINPSNECQDCNPITSPRAWNPRTGTTCDDGDYCTYGEICTSSGTCEGLARSLLEGAVQISAGGDHTCAVVDTGGVRCWGFNTVGELGDGTDTSRDAPVPVSGLSSGVDHVDAGSYHTCALTTTGGVKCWGWNSEGQLGDDSTTDRWTPVDVWGLTSGATQVCAGHAHSCALLGSGEVRCWGGNAYGQLGKGDSGTITGSDRPVAVLEREGYTGNLGSIDAIGCGAHHTCALNTADNVLCWGYNFYGQLGIDSTVTPRTRPTTVVATSGLSAPLSGVDEISLGGNHTCARNGGSVKCWGQNNHDQLGDGSGANQWAPVDVRNPGGSVLTGAAGLELGPWHSCVVTDTDMAMCWGRGDYGQLGDGIDGSGHTQPFPILVRRTSSAYLGSVNGFAAGTYHSCSIYMTDGWVFCWGRNHMGQLGDGTNSDALYGVYVHCN